MDHQIKESMQKAIELTLAKGANEADVIASAGDSFSLSVQNQAIDKYKVSGSKVLGIRAIKDDKVGLAYTEAFDDESLGIAAEKALENAKNSQPRIEEKIVVSGSEFIKESDFQPEEISTNEKIDLVKNLEAQVKQRDSRVSGVPYNGFSEVTSQSYYLNSKETFNFESEYYQSCYTSALMQEGTVNSMHYHGVMARKFSQLDTKTCIEESLLHAGEWLKAESLKTGSYDLIFHPDAFDGFFGCFSGIFSGKGAMDKVNPFGDKIGEQVLSEKITIQDIPQYKDAFFNSYCDSEGMVQKDLTLVENGRLTNFLHNSVTANYFKTQSNARAARGARSALGVGGSTKVFGVGDQTDKNIQAGKYFEVVSMQGLHSGKDSYSGEFSFAASGYFCEDGVRKIPVKGVTVSGNFYKMMKEVEILGNELKANSGLDFFAPLFRFEGVSVGGSH